MDRRWNHGLKAPYSDASSEFCASPGISTITTVDSSAIDVAVNIVKAVVTSTHVDVGSAHTGVSQAAGIFSTAHFDVQASNRRFVGEECIGGWVGSKVHGRLDVYSTSHMNDRS